MTTACLLCGAPYGHPKLQVSRLSRLGPSECPQFSLSIKLQASPRANQAMQISVHEKDHIAGVQLNCQLLTGSPPRQGKQSLMKAL